MAESFGAIYERNAINAALPVLTADQVGNLELSNGDRVYVNLGTGEIRNETRGKTIRAVPLSGIQMDIYRQGGLLGPGRKSP